MKARLRAGKLIDDSQNNSSYNPRTQCGNTNVSLITIQSDQGIFRRLYHSMYVKRAIHFTTPHQHKSISVCVAAKEASICQVLFEKSKIESSEA